MTARAVYASQTLNTYITREDLAPALLVGVIRLDLNIGDHTIPDAHITIMLDDAAAKALRMVTDAERQVIARKRLEMAEVTTSNLQSPRKRVRRVS
jgi:hypothetical protein